MGKTEALRGLVANLLRQQVGLVHYRTASKSSDYPYATYEVGYDFPDGNLVNSELTVDLWDRSGDWKRIEGVADEIENTFNCANLPTGKIFPTFFRESRIPIEDPDKSLQHIQIHFSVHLYEEE